MDGWHDAARSGAPSWSSFPFVMVGCVSVVQQRAVGHTDRQFPEGRYCKPQSRLTTKRFDNRSGPLKPNGFADLLCPVEQLQTPQGTEHPTLISRGAAYHTPRVVGEHGTCLMGTTTTLVSRPIWTQHLLPKQPMFVIDLRYHP